MNHFLFNSFPVHCHKKAGKSSGLDYYSSPKRKKTNNLPANTILPEDQFIVQGAAKRTDKKQTVPVVYYFMILAVKGTPSPSLFQ